MHRTIYQTHPCQKSPPVPGASLSLYLVIFQAVCKAQKVARQVFVFIRLPVEGQPVSFARKEAANATGDVQHGAKTNVCRRGSKTRSTQPLMTMFLAPTIGETLNAVCDQELPYPAILSKRQVGATAADELGADARLIFIDLFLSICFCYGRFSQGAT